MKNRVAELFLSVVLLAFLAVMLFLYVALPAESYSESEKRTLPAFPKLNMQTVLSGSFESNLEIWLADHMPGRQFFVGLNAYYDRFMGQQAEKDIYTGEGNRLFERPVRRDEMVIRRNMAAINSFAENLGREVNLMIVPSAGWVLEDELDMRGDPYIDDSLINEIYALTEENIQPLALHSLFRSLPQAERERLYYRTDHHWTSAGAQMASAFYTEKSGQETSTVTEYSIRKFEGFTGSTYSRACLWAVPAETLELWDSGGSFTVSLSDRDEVHEGLFYEERLTHADKYPVFLDGNHPLVTIENPDAASDRTLLLIRDSFGSSFACFVADAYSSVTLIDLRYYKVDVAEFIAENSFDDILILYSLGNFMSDANIVWLG